MISREEYIKDPCGTLSIPYWKHNGFSVPENIRIVHGSDYDAVRFAGYADEQYFRLRHGLCGIGKACADGFCVRTAGDDDIDMIVELINASYKDLSVTRAQIWGYRQRDVFESDLWVLACDGKTGEPVGCGIAELDKQVGEGILEWIQVLVQYRRRGVGGLIVNELLWRMRPRADFATVSGKVNNDTQPEGLYRKCGFTGCDVWHILSGK